MLCLYHVLFFSISIMQGVSALSQTLLRAWSPFLGDVQCNTYPIPSIPSIDGTCNSLLSHNTILFGSAGRTLIRDTPNSYVDQIQQPPVRVSPRVVSNEISAQSHSMPNQFHATQLVPFFGQFVDHDLDLTLEGKTERFDIPIMPGDCLGDNHCPTHLEFFRSEPAYKDSSNTRQFRNILTAHLDLSSVYGSTKDRAQKLRAFKNGRLKSRTINGQEFLPLNKNVGIEMDRDARNTLAAGDRRANEHLILISLTTLFVREHNRLARKIRKSNPQISDEKCFQAARMRNIAQYQSIVYGQFIPAVLGDFATDDLLGYYQGYIPQIKPDISLEFSTAIFRWGHSAIPDKVVFMNRNGVVKKELNLIDTFFAPQTFEKDPSLLDFGLIGITRHLHEEIDTKVVNGLRIGLFQNVQQPIDLVSLNLQRGRDHGIGSLNALRYRLSLRPINGPTEWAKFYNLVGNKKLATKLYKLYGQFESCDLWVCGLAEKRYRDSQLGLTFSRAMASQFRKLRDGNRFYYEQFPHLIQELNLPIGIEEIYGRNIPSLNEESMRNKFVL